MVVAKLARDSRRPSTRPRDVFVLLVLLAVGRGAPPGRPPPSQPHHQARGAHGLLSSIRRLLGRRRAPKPPGLLQRCVRAVRRTRLLQSPWRATPVLHSRYFAGSGLRITGGRGLPPARQSSCARTRRTPPRCASLCCCASPCAIGRCSGQDAVVRCDKESWNHVSRV